MQHRFSLRYSRFSILYGIQVLFLIIFTNFVLLNALLVDILIVKMYTVWIIQNYSCPVLGNETKKTKNDLCEEKHNRIKLYA